MNKINKNKDTPDEVISLFREFLDRKKNNDQFTWKGDGERLINMAKKYLDTAKRQGTLIKDPILKQEINKTINLASTFYETNIKRLIIKF